MKEFDLIKKNQLMKKDKSNEQRIDPAIRNLCEKINRKKDYYTTSSCSGRIVLVKGLKDKAKNVFLLKAHEKISFTGFKKQIKNFISSMGIQIPSWFICQ